MALSPKQEKFCLAYVETDNASEAYRMAGYSPSMSAKTVTEAASRLLKNSNVIARLAELRAGHLERHNLTVDDISRMLQEDRKFARDLEAPAAAISASLGLAKLYGHMTEKHEHSGTIFQYITERTERSAP